MSRSNIEGILEAARAADVEVLLVGMQAPGNFGLQFKQAFDTIYPDLSERYDTMLVPDFFAGFGTAPGDLAAARPYMQADGIHPNAEGVGRIVASIGPVVLDLIGRVEGGGS
jgi:acyl-CoA thioesterase-1